MFATFRVVGFHYWVDAPLECVYLRTTHRHEFHVRVEVSVGHNNRQIEFIALKEAAKKIFISMAVLGSFGYDFGQRSCEMMAAELDSKLVVQGYAVRSVEVSEDGENGGGVRA